jgi:Gas vesicle synthesis protein GvpL/GvpF
MTDESGVWAYAVAARIAPGWLSGLAGVAGQPVEVVTAAGLAAAVSTVSLAEFGAAALRRHLEDLDWLETTGRAHHRVVAAVAEHTPAIPLRLATVYRDRGRLSDMLAARQPDFAAAIGRVTARTEWGVKVFAAGREAGAPQPGGPAAADPASADAADSGGTERPGAAYLRRRRTQLDAGSQVRRAAADSAEAIHATLGGLAAATDVRPPQAPQLTGRREQMILNGAYLVDDDRSAEFAATVERLAGSHEPVRVELTGPWPPYSFGYVGEPGAGEDGGTQ